MALDSGPVAMQVVSVDEALAAAHAGCGVVMVDTGSLDDLAAVTDALRTAGFDLPVAFGGGVSAADLHAAARGGASIVDIGRAILDAPLWDLHLEVVRRDG
jgi:nicotinate-nucleotide pyrophosphorylase (carboxylating)